MEKIFAYFSQKVVADEIGTRGRNATPVEKVLKALKAGTFDHWELVDKAQKT